MKTRLILLFVILAGMNANATECVFKSRKTAPSVHLVISKNHDCELNGKGVPLLECVHVISLVEQFSRDKTAPRSPNSIQVDVSKWTVSCGKKEAEALVRGRSVCKRVAGFESCEPQHLTAAEDLLNYVLSLKP